MQELSGSTATANLISGGIDEVFTRADATGTFTPLQDALGSTIALVDASGNLVTQYAYDPFGNTTVSGTPNSNTSQYTGRENEGNGLYFYRARYYSPLLGRFVSEDPAGEGQNFYAYADDDPIEFSDPLGLWPWGNTAPADLPSTGTNGGLKLIQGGAGRFLPRGAGRLGLAVSWLFLTQDSLTKTTRPSRTSTQKTQPYGAEWQSVIAYNQAVLAHPRPLPLAGRYTPAQQRRKEWLRYKDVCHGQVPDSGDRCSNLSRDIDRVNRCIKLRQDFDKKWNTSHLSAINQALNELQNLKNDYDKDCTSQTW